MLTKTAFLFMLLFLKTLSLYCQDFKSSPGYRFTKEDQYQIYLDQSKKQKTKAIIAVIAGPILTVTGAYIASKGGPTITGGSNGFITIQDNDTKGLIGSSIGAFGIITTLSSIPFFISSSKWKKKAALLLKDEPTSFFNRTLRIPGLTLRIPL